MLYNIHNTGEIMNLEQHLGHASSAIGLPIYLLFIIPIIVAFAFQIVRSSGKKQELAKESFNAKPEASQRKSVVAALASFLFLAFAGLFSYQVFTGKIHSLRSVNFENLAR